MSYPVNLNVKNKICLIVGGGKVGARKARGLHAAGAYVTVLSSSFHEQIDNVTYIDARYEAAYLREIKPWLVITCTDSHATNAQIQNDAEVTGAIVMRADDSKAGDAHGLMKREPGGLTVTAATGVPTLSRYLLDQIEAEILTPALITMATELASIRAELRQTLPTAEDRTAAWQQITPAYADWLARLQTGEQVNFRVEINAMIGGGLAE